MVILGGNTYFSADYATSRHRFLRAAEAAGATLHTAPFSCVGPDGSALSLDVARLGPADAKRVVVVSSGLHGVEGFMGAAVQLALLEDPPALPDGVALVLQHALNPYGFSHLRRVDAENIDLNRNMLQDGERYEGAPEGYAAMDGLLNPPTAPGRFAAQRFLAQAVFRIARAGMGALKGAVAGGQYTFPKGVFFGGSGPSETNRVLTKHVPGWFEGVEHLLQVDFHTGLGKSASYKLLVDHPPSTERLSWLTAQFGNAVQPWDQGDGVAYAIRGGLGTWMKAHLPEAEVDVLCAEFGTVPALSVITAMHLENRAHHHGDPRDPAIKERFLETFIPRSSGWRDAVVDQGHRIVLQALAAIG